MSIPRRFPRARSRGAPVLLPVLVLLLVSPIVARTAHGGGASLEVFGSEFAGENFVFVLDVDPLFASSPDFQLMKAGVIQALADLAPGQNFNIVATGFATEQFWFGLAPATALNLTAAVGWVDALTPSRSPCSVEALVRGLNMFQVHGEGGVLLYSGLSFPNCVGMTETLGLVAIANGFPSPIHTFLPPNAPAGASLFHETLAAENGGEFVTNLTVSIPPSIIRGDANGDGTVDLADAIAILSFGFGSSSAPICELASDSNDDNVFTPIADATTILGVLFVSGFPPLASPYPDCGFDSFPAGSSCAVNDCP